MPTPREEAPTVRDWQSQVMDVNPDEDDVGGAAPVPDDAGAPPQTEPETPAESEEEAAEAPPEPDELEEELEEEPEAPAEPVDWQPPEGGEPFAFRVDGTDVEVPGALRYEHGIYVPTDAWTIVQKHLADREVISARERQFEQRIQSLDPARHPDVLQAQETLKAFQALLQQGPIEVAKWLDNYEQNRPLLEAQIQLAATRAQLEARSQQMGDTEFEQQAEQLSQQLPGYLKQNIEAAIAADPAMKDLVGATDAVFEQLWPMAEMLFFEADRDYPEHGVRRGQIIVRPDVLSRLLKQQASTRAEMKRLQAAARTNAKATGKTKTAPTVSTRGRPIPAGQSKAYQPGDTRSWKEDFLASDLLEE